MKRTCFGLPIEYPRANGVVTASWFSQIDYGIEALVKQYLRFLQGKPTDWRIPIDVLSVRFESIYIPQDYGIVQATLVFLSVLRLTTFRTKEKE